MSTEATKAREPARTKSARTSAAPDPPGEVPADLKEQGWTLREHVNDDGDFKLVNSTQKKETSSYATPQLAFDAARRIANKGKEGAKGEAQKVAVSRRFSQPLKTKLTGAELLDRLGTWRKKRDEKATLEAEAKQTADSYKSLVGKLDSEIKATEKALATEHEERDVQCEERMDYDRKRVFVVRLDTGDELEGQARPMTAKELQPKLLKL